MVTVDAQDNLDGDSSSYEPEYVLRVEQMLLDWGRSDGDVSGRESMIDARKSAERRRSSRPHYNRRRPSTGSG